MNLILNQLIPYSLKDKITPSSSAIWSQSLTFEESNKIKLKPQAEAGKTTLTHLLYKVRTDYTGSITYGEHNLEECCEDALAELRQNHISIVFQDLRLFNDLTAFENIEIKRLLTPQFSPKELIYQMSEELGVSGILNQKIRFCSYGEQQRIAIIRAMMQPFNWLILDEPFSHLDQNNITLASSIIEQACIKRNAGLIIMGLNKDQYFEYSKELLL
jgi:putative ABC transport system ATP-binding protein